MGGGGGYQERRGAGNEEGVRPQFKTTLLQGASNAKLSFLPEGTDMS